MSDPLLNALLATAPNHPLALAADAYCRNYEPLNRSESWRWTPLSVLRGTKRRIGYADYQIDGARDIKLSEVTQKSEAALAALLEDSDAPFAALNLALLEDTLHLRVAAGRRMDKPIVIDLRALGEVWRFARIALHLEADACASLWLDMTCQDAAGHLPVLLVTLEERATLEGVLRQSGQDDKENAQLLYVRTDQAAHSTLRLNVVQHRNALARVDVNAQLNGDGADFAFGGIQVLRDVQVGDFHVAVRHKAENSTSRQMVRGALDGKSTGIFDGLIYVADGAQLTEARQESRFILLSDQAKAQSMPRLEIHADDVQCAHGATVGFLDPEALFYLQSRGIGMLAARNLLLFAFLQEAVVIKEAALKDKFLQALDSVWKDKNHA